MNTAQQKIEDLARRAATGELLPSEIEEASAALKIVEAQKAQREQADYNAIRGDIERARNRHEQEFKERFLDRK